MLAVDAMRTMGKPVVHCRRHGLGTTRVRNHRRWGERAHPPRCQRALRNSRTTIEGPFGEVLRLSGSAAKENPFRFSSKRANDTSDLVLYEYRAYSASTGRWLSRDPIGALGGVNAYGFLRNTIGSIDVLGMQEVGDPNCAPCRFLGYRHEVFAGDPERGLPKMGPDDIGFTHVELQPKHERILVVPKQDCGCGRLMIQPIEWQCTVTIYIRPGHQLDEPTHMLTLRKHEGIHAYNAGQWFDKELTAWRIAGEWCLSPRCSDKRDRYLNDLFDFYDAERRYLNLYLHFKDGGTQEVRDKSREGAMSAWNSMIKSKDKAEEARRAVIDCVSEDRDLPLTKFPSKPALPTKHVLDPVKW